MIERRGVYVLRATGDDEGDGDGTTTERVHWYPSVWCGDMRSQRLAVRFATAAIAIAWRNEMVVASPQSRAWMRACVPVRLVKKKKADDWTTERVLNRAIRLLQIQNDELVVALNDAHLAGKRVRGGAP